MNLNILLGFYATCAIILSVAALTTRGGKRGPRS